MTRIFILLGLLALVCLVFLAATRRNWRREKRFRAATAAGGGLVTGAATLLLLPLALHLNSYLDLNPDAPAATLTFTELGPQKFEVILQVPQAPPYRTLILMGDEWQLDARFLAWRGVAAWMGLPPRYRLERLGGRYTDIRDEQNQPRAVHGLNDRRGPDAWIAVRKWKRWIPIADAYYGSATYLPMADGAQFVVRITRNGLAAQPANEAAELAVSDWTE